MVLASHHPSATRNLVVTPRFLEDLWIPNHKTTVGLTDWCIKIQSPYFMNTKQQYCEHHHAIWQYS